MVDAQAHGVVIALGRVHPGPGKLDVALAHRLIAQGQFGILAGRQPQGNAAAGGLKAAVDALSVAVLVVAGVLVLAEHLQVALLVAGLQVGIQADTLTIVVVAGTHTALLADRIALELRRIALEQYGTATAAGAMLQGGHALADRHAIDAVQRRLGGGRVHAVGTATEHIAPVDQDIQGVALLAADHRVEAMATHANAFDAVQAPQPFTGIGRRCG